MSARAVKLPVRSVEAVLEHLALPASLLGTVVGEFLLRALKQQASLCAAMIDLKWS